MLVKDPVDVQFAEKFQKDIAELVKPFAEVFEPDLYRHFKGWKLEHYVRSAMYKGVLDATDNSLIGSARKLEVSPSLLMAIHAAYLGKVDYKNISVNAVNDFAHVHLQSGAINEVLLINEKKGEYYAAK